MDENEALRAENERLRKAVESGRQYEIMVREQAVWEAHLDRVTELSPSVVEEVKKIHHHILRCDEVVGEDGLCECNRYIGYILAGKERV